MQFALCGVRVAEEYQVLTTADLCTRVSAGDDAHTFDALWHTHVWIEYRAVGGEVHPSDVVCRERSVLHLNPCLTLSVLILDAGGVVGQHLVDANVLGSLSHHRRGACQQDTTKQDSDFIHFIGVLLYVCFYPQKKSTMICAVNILRNIANGYTVE